MSQASEQIAIIKAIVNGYKPWLQPYRSIICSLCGRKTRDRKAVEVNGQVKYICFGHEEET